MTILEILEEIKKGSPKAYKQMLGMLGDSSYFLKTLTEYMEKDPIGAKSFLTEWANTIEDRETFHEQKEKKKWALSLASDLETLVDCLHGSKAGTTARTVKGIAIMVGANKGVWMFGMLTASSFGVAGTGTGIGTLSGAAFTSASLAWIGGSVATGTALLGAAGIALTLLIKSKGLSKSRKKADFSEEELEIDEAATGLAVALRTYFNDKSADTPLYRELVRRDGIAPIALRLDRVKSGHLGFFKKTTS